MEIITNPNVTKRKQALIGGRYFEKFVVSINTKHPFQVQLYLILIFADNGGRNNQ